ncbi:MAG: hypothetical protein DMG42_20265 [Acidobacteria bacterium]|nr:MAG: hypothetical protein DMG42_20265 [Acidobacteriota bacterium]
MAKPQKDDRDLLEMLQFELRCLLMKFVPPGRATEQIPCGHIPLNSDGETLASLYESATQLEIEEALGNWLRATIHRLERERAAANS